jgi:tetratricopeptide (TPR) repeat protein
VLSYSRRFLLATVLVLLVPLGVPAEPPVAKQIAQWIEQLGDSRFAARENASKKLWQAGAAAESDLEKATKSDDPEVVRRARDLLDKFRWGIYPDTPADIVALIRTYQSSEENARVEALQKLLDGGDMGLRAILKIATTEKDANRRKVLGALVSHKLPSAFQSAVIEGKFEHFERLLELGHEGQFIDNNQFAAYWLLRGKLPEAIARFRTRLSEHPDEKWFAQTLVYLHRANDDLAEARKAAEKSGRDDLLEGILQEMGDWQALAARPMEEARPKSDEKSLLEIIERVEKWSYRAAYTRLAGKQKEFETAIRALKKLEVAKNLDEIDLDKREYLLDLRAFVAAKGLLLNDRPADGLDVLRTEPKRHIMVFDLLCAQLYFAAAMEFAEKPRPIDKETSGLNLARARLLCFLGDKEGEEQFKRYGERIKDEVDPQWVESLLTEEIRSGLKDLAFAHAAKAMSVSTPKIAGNLGSRMRVPEDYLSQLFPQQAATAKVWWIELRQHQFESETHAAVLKRLRDLMEGKIAAKEVKAWIEAAERRTSSPTAKPVEPSTRLALAETAVKAGLDDLAISLLEKADSHEALQRLGDLLAAKKQWGKAAERYRQAWKKQSEEAKRMFNRTQREEEMHDPLPLYLAGDALVRAGREVEGKKLMEQAHWLPLADAAVRHRFLLGLSERGYTEAAVRETDLLLHVSEPNSYYSGAAIRRWAVAALSRKEYLKAADGFEQSMLRCFHSYTSFVSSAGYVNVPAQIHQLRASGLLAAGNIEAALKQAQLALDDAPGYVDAIIALVPEMERLGHKKEATALFERCNGTYEKVCRDYPRCAWAHNSTAWMSACCRRNLDKALTHAEKAVELAPTNAGYVDTLAEVHFQRGDKDKALAMQKRAIELDPKKVYYHKQLKRIEAGDPKAERPPENEE